MTLCQFILLLLTPGPQPAFDAATRGLLDGWEDDPISFLALVILLDQFPRILSVYCSPS